jgi:hypothetical protein
VTTLNRDNSFGALAQIKHDLSRIDGKVIGHHVTQIFEKYRIELIRNIERLEQA